MTFYITRLHITYQVSHEKNTIHLQNIPLKNCYYSFYEIQHLNELLFIKMLHSVILRKLKNKIFRCTKNLILSLYNVRLRSFTLFLSLELSHMELLSISKFSQSQTFFHFKFPSFWIVLPSQSSADLELRHSNTEERKLFHKKKQRIY